MASAFLARNAQHSDFGLKAVRFDVVAERNQFVARQNRKIGASGMDGQMFTPVEGRGLRPLCRLRRSSICLGHSVAPLELRAVPSGV